MPNILINYHVYFTRKFTRNPRFRPSLWVDFDFGGNLASGAKALFSVKYSETLPPFNNHSLFILGSLSESVTELGILVSL